MSAAPIVPKVWSFCTTLCLPTGVFYAPRVKTNGYTLSTNQVA